MDSHKLWARMQGAFDSAMDGIVAVDANQRIVLFNEAAERIFLRTRAEAMGQPLDILIPERFRATHRQHMERFGKTGISARRMGGASVLLGLRADGKEFPIEASISQDGEGADKVFTVILRDVSSRLRADEALSRSEARLRGILDSAMDAIITVDEEQRIVLFNTAAEIVFGYAQVEAIGAHLSILLPERYRSAHDEHVRRFGATGVTSRRMGTFRVLTGKRRNGEEFPLEASISQVHEDGGRAFYTVILRDVTERLRAEEALRRSKEELRELAAVAQSVREQEKSRIARELHDELGQSLTALKMDVIALRNELLADPHVQERIARIESMLNETVASTRRISADLRPLMLDDLGLSAAVEWLIQGFTQRTGIECNVNAAGDLDLGDPHATAVFRVLQESLTNIAKHAQATRVDITIAHHPASIQLVVQDNGIGFRPDGPRKLNSHGLLGVRERAYLLNGEAHIQSAPGQGSRIEFYLPLSDAAPEGPATPLPKT